MTEHKIHFNRVKNIYATRTCISRQFIQNCLGKINVPEEQDYFHQQIGLQF